MAKNMKDYPVKNPFGYCDKRSMLVWKVAQTCVWLIHALWRDSSDCECITSELNGIIRAVEDLNAYTREHKSN